MAEKGDRDKKKVDISLLDRRPYGVDSVKE